MVQNAQIAEAQVLSNHCLAILVQRQATKSVSQHNVQPSSTGNKCQKAAAHTPTLIPTKQQL